MVNKNSGLRLRSSQPEMLGKRMKDSDNTSLESHNYPCFDIEVEKETNSLSDLDMAAHQSDTHGVCFKEPCPQKLSDAHLSEEMDIKYENLNTNHQQMNMSKHCGVHQTYNVNHEPVKSERIPKINNQHTVDNAFQGQKSSAYKRMCESDLKGTKCEIELINLEERKEERYEQMDCFIKKRRYDSVTGNLNTFATKNYNIDNAFRDGNYSEPTLGSAIYNMEQGSNQKLNQPNAQSSRNLRSNDHNVHTQQLGSGLKHNDELPASECLPIVGNHGQSCSSSSITSNNTFPYQCNPNEFNSLRFDGSEMNSQNDEIIDKVERIADNVNIFAPDTGNDSAFSRQEEMVKPRKTMDEIFQKLYNKPLYSIQRKDDSRLKPSERLLKRTNLFTDIGKQSEKLNTHLLGSNNTGLRNLVKPERNYIGDIDMPSIAEKSEKQNCRPTSKWTGFDEEEMFGETQRIHRHHPQYDLVENHHMRPDEDISHNVGYGPFQGHCNSNLKRNNDVLESSTWPNTKFEKTVDGMNCASTVGLESSSMSNSIIYNIGLEPYPNRKNSDLSRMPTITNVCITKSPIANDQPTNVSVLNSIESISYKKSANNGRFAKETFTLKPNNIAEREYFDYHHARSHEVHTLDRNQPSNEVPENLMYDVTDEQPTTTRSTLRYGSNNDGYRSPFSRQYQRVSIGLAQPQLRNNHGVTGTSNYIYKDNFVYPYIIVIAIVSSF